MSSPIPFPAPTNPSPESVKVGWYGLGSMGFLMARNLAKHRATLPGTSSLVVYNRSVKKCEELQKLLGPEVVQIAASPEELVLQCDVVCTSLANDAVVKAVYAQFAKTLKETPPTSKKILVEMSTCYPTVTAEVGAQFTEIPNTTCITSPVFGPPASADNGTLICVYSGEYAAKQLVSHIHVPGLGKKAMDLGTDIKRAPTFKLIGNSMILGTLEILAESFTLADKAGIGAATAYELVKDMFPAHPFINYGNRMSSNHFDASHGFSTDGGLKDASHMSQLAADLNSPMPAIVRPLLSLDETSI